MVAYLAYVSFRRSLCFMNVFCKRKPATCLRELLTRFCYGPGASIKLASVLLVTCTGLFCASGGKYKGLCFTHLNGLTIVQHQLQIIQKKYKK